MIRLILLAAMLVQAALADVTNIAPAVSAPTSVERLQLEGRLQEGFSALKEGRNNEAIAVFRGILAADAGNRSAKYGIATALIQQNKVREAQQVLEALMTQFPADFVLKNNAAWLYATSTNRYFRNPERAVALARDALMLAPENVHVWSTLADAHYAAGDFEKAVKAAAHAVELAQRAGGGSEARPYQEQSERMRKAAEAFSLLE